jgi:hypothetical protein
MPSGRISDGLPPSPTWKKKRFPVRQAMILPNGCRIRRNWPPESGVTSVAARLSRLRRSGERRILSHFNSPALVPLISTPIDLEGSPGTTRRTRLRPLRPDTISLAPARKASLPEKPRRCRRRRTTWIPFSRKVLRVRGNFHGMPCRRGFFAERLRFPRRPLASRSGSRGYDRLSIGRARRCGHSVSLASLRRLLNQSNRRPESLLRSG